MEATSSSAIDMEITGRVSACMPDALYSLKNATFESPFNVLTTASAPEVFSLLTMVLKSVEPIGVYSSPTTSMPLPSAYALTMRFAVCGNT